MSATTAVNRLPLARLLFPASRCERIAPAVQQHQQQRHPQRCNIQAIARPILGAIARNYFTTSSASSKRHLHRASPLSQTPIQADTSPFQQPSLRHSSSSSSTRWKSRQTTDPHAAAAKLAGLKSRAAFKLLEISQRHHLFHPGDLVVDLGFAPGSWSQVAVNRTKPDGRVVGIDVLPAQPPKGVSTLQGDFLSEGIQEEVRRFVRDPLRGRPRSRVRSLEGLEGGVEGGEGSSAPSPSSVPDAENVEDVEEHEADVDDAETKASSNKGSKSAPTAQSQKELDRAQGRVVNVVLSDMSEPWPQDASTWLRTVSNPFRRMMNTSGMAFRDHAGSMDLCHAALKFSYDTLVTNGNFLCKFYDGSEAHAFEMKLKKLFEKVHRIKPDASRKESKEAYFVGLKRRPDVSREEVLGEGG